MTGVPHFSRLLREVGILYVARVAHVSGFETWGFCVQLGVAHVSGFETWGFCVQLGVAHVSVLRRGDFVCQI